MNQGNKKIFKQVMDREELSLFRKLVQKPGGRWHLEGDEWDEFTCGEPVEILIDQAMLGRGFRFEALDGKYYITNGHLQFFPLQVFVRRPERIR